jgi:hypothetical protein
MKKEVNRIYKMTDADLCMFTSNLVQKIRRDATEFLAKGVDASEVDALETKGNDFEVLPDDLYYSTRVTESQHTKNGLREDLEMQVRELIGIVRVKWGRSSPQVKRFGASGMTTMKDNDFLRIARKSVKLGTDFLTDLADYGWTAAKNTAIETTAQELEDALNDVDDKMLERDIKTQERIDEGNDLYITVAKYCELGKIIWQDIDEARYNDYVIYPEHPELPGKIQGLVYDTASGSLTWIADARATSYTVEFAYYTGAEPVWTIIYEGPATSYTYDPGGPDDYLFHVRGKNEFGSGLWSDTLQVSH